MYGEIPPAPKQFAGRVLGEHRDFLGGRATLKLVRLECGAEPDAPRIDLMLVLPNQAPKKAAGVPGDELLRQPRHHFRSPGAAGARLGL